MLKNDILLAFLLCVSSVAIAQQNPLLEKYRSMAVEYSHDLKVADKNIAASIELEKAAQKELYPKLAGETNFQYTGNPLQLTLDLPSMGTATFEGKNMKYSASVSLLQPIYTGGRLLENIRLAKYRHNISVFQEEYIRSGIYSQTDMLYWNTVARTEIVRISEDYRSSVASLVQTIRERVEAGLTDPQDLLMMEVKLNEAEYQLLQAQKNFENGRMALNSLIGVELQAQTEVEDSVAVVRMADGLLYEIDNNVIRPEQKIVMVQLNMAESEKKLIDSKYKPQFHIGIDGSYSSPGYDFRTDAEPNYVVYAKVSVPLFEWGKRRNEKRASTFKINMVTDNLNKVTDGVKLEIQTAHNSLRQAMAQVDLTQKSLNKAWENEVMSLERYNEGKISVIEVIDAQTYRQAAQINHVQAKVSAQSHYSELLKALNKY